MKQNVLCDDMETAPLFVVGRLRGMKCASILNNVVAFAGDKEEGVGSYSTSVRSAAMTGEKNEILTALEAIAKMEGKQL